MTALEFIGLAQAKAADAKLREAGELLLRPSPATLQASCDLLGEVTQILEELMAANRLGQPLDKRLEKPPANAREQALGAAKLSPQFAQSLLPIRQAAEELQAQIEHGSRFCQGWLQTRRGVGYTANGAPVMLDAAFGSTQGSGEGRSFEL